MYIGILLPSLDVISSNDGLASIGSFDELIRVGDELSFTADALAVWKEGLIFRSDELNVPEGT